ncbi:MAG TPA: FKBP-type peptidyl-prolyl cis-trans isomerase [Acidimicrobiia bacterium]|nr:FKBP-type peptidyl-prolyl cis-trans isomerase [Acidimicrobiia bacterium]
MRRLLLVIALVAAALGASVLPASAATGPLGKVTVTGTDGEKPTVTFAKPFSTTSSAHRILVPGSGAKLGKGEKVALDYVLIDGRTGAELETSFGKSPAALTLDPKQSSAVLVNSLLGAKVGSRVLVAIAPKEGLTNSTSLQQAGVKKNDTLLFLLDVKSLHKPLARAAGAAVTPPPGLPTVTLGAKGKPSIKVPKTDPPAQLVVQPLIKGTGAPVQAGQTITVQYTGVVWGTGKQFDSSWDRGQPADFVIGQGQVIPGWDTGLVGQTVGSQVLLVIPPDQGYGAQGNPQGGIKGTDTLVFVVDILDAV